MCKCGRCCIPPATFSGWLTVDFGNIYSQYPVTWVRDTNAADPVWNATDFGALSVSDPSEFQLTYDKSGCRLFLAAGGTAVYNAVNHAPCPSGPACDRWYRWGSSVFGGLQSFQHPENAAYSVNHWTIFLNPWNQCAFRCGCTPNNVLYVGSSGLLSARAGGVSVTGGAADINDYWHHGRGMRKDVGGTLHQLAVLRENTVPDATTRINYTEGNLLFSVVTPILWSGIQNQCSAFSYTLTPYNFQAAGQGNRTVTFTPATYCSGVGPNPENL